jgi:hypothetical protein
MCFARLEVVSVEHHRATLPRGGALYKDIWSARESVSGRVACDQQSAVLSNSEFSDQEPRCNLPAPWKPIGMYINRLPFQARAGGDSRTCKCRAVRRCRITEFPAKRLSEVEVAHDQCMIWYRCSDLGYARAKEG